MKNDVTNSNPTKRAEALRAEAIEAEAEGFQTLAEHLEALAQEAWGEA